MARIPILGAEHIMSATMEPPTQATAYTEGWHACMRGEDGRFTNPYPLKSTGVTPSSRMAFLHLAWAEGFVDAMEAEDGEQPQPKSVGYS